MNKKAECAIIYKGDKMNHTIVAIATPIGTGGVGIIRMSGPTSFTLLEKIFTPQTQQEFSPRKMVFGHLSFDGITDDCLAVFFSAPNSFTGEDVVEIQMHGGVALLNETVKKLIELGATMAEPGEFSKRAVLNGKMDITQAEGLIDMIYAQSTREMQIASSQMRGELHKKITDTQKQLTDILAIIEVALDFPEHEENNAEENIAQTLPVIIQEIQNLINTEDVGAKIKSGVNVALVGEPNVGKSSLLNVLVGYDRAIVTDIPGTTRDTIAESYLFNGVRFNIIDTAGLRESEDIIEKEGMRRTLQSLQDCDFVLKIYENTTSAKEISSFSEIKTSNFAKILNKCDLNKNNADCFDIQISAKENINITELKQLIYDRTIDKNLISSQIIITNVRHSQLLKQALKSLQQAEQDLDKVSLDCTALLVRQAWDLLGQITGETSNEKVIDAIFSKFCLGK